MKKFIFTLTIICSISISTILSSQNVVNLHSNGIVTNYYGTNAFTQAFNAAINGDTIYLSGGSFNNPTTFNKRLTIFGSGFFQDSLVATGQTFLNSSITLESSASGSYFEGFEFSGNITFSNNASVNNVIFRRCRINGIFSVPGNLTTSSNNLSLLENVFINTVSLNNATNVIISNNIFQGLLQSSNSNYISNNIFLNNHSGLNSIGGDNNTIVNNIFFNGFWVSGSGNIFINNLSPLAAANIHYSTNPTIVNTFAGTPLNTVFVGQNLSNIYSYSNNYNLANPTQFIGNDGTQIGIYGGNFPVKAGHIPKTPHISHKNISTTTNNNGELGVQIRVNAQNN